MTDNDNGREEPDAGSLHAAIDESYLTDAERAEAIARLAEDIDARGLPSVQRDRVTTWRSKARSLATVLANRDGDNGGE